MKEIKTNTIELPPPHKKPCDTWSERLVDGEIDMHVTFKRYGEKCF